MGSDEANSDDVLASACSCACVASAAFLAKACSRWARSVLNQTLQHRRHQQALTTLQLSSLSLSRQAGVGQLKDGVLVSQG